MKKLGSAHCFRAGIAGVRKVGACLEKCFERANAFASRLAPTGIFSAAKIQCGSELAREWGDSVSAQLKPGGFQLGVLVEGMQRQIAAKT